MTEAERSGHIQNYQDNRTGLNNALDEWDGCGGPPGGLLGTLTLLAGEYLRDKSIDEAAQSLKTTPRDDEDGVTFLGRRWHWKPHWPSVPDLPKIAPPSIGPFGPAPVLVP